MIENLDNKLSELGLSLPKASSAAGVYVPALVVGQLAVISGQLPIDDDGSMIKGIVGRDVDLVKAQQAALLCALNVLAQIDRICREQDMQFDRMVSVQGFVCADASFTDHPKVINAASELFCTVLGEAGKHTRIAVGNSSLPLGAAVEISAWAAVRAD